MRTRVWRAVRFRACWLKRKWYTVCRSKKTRECVIGFIYRIDGIDWRPVNTFQFRPDFWHIVVELIRNYKCILALWLNNYFHVGNLKNWEVIRSISVKNATIHFKFEIVCKYVVNQSCSWGSYASWFGDQRIEAVRCHKINELIFRLMRMRLEDVDIKITHNILDSLFSRLMADKISSIC